MRITEYELRRIIREEIKRSHNFEILNEAVLIEGFLQDLSDKVSTAAVIGLLMLPLTGKANAEGFISHLNKKMNQIEAQENTDDLEVEGVGNLQQLQKELKKELYKRPFGGHIILSDYVQKFKDMGSAGEKIMKEVLSLFEKNPELKKKYGLVYRAFKNMSDDIVLKKIGF